MVILGETPITEENKLMFTDYLETGGNLVAFRPDRQLSELFGITRIDTTISQGYIQINTSDNIGIGLNQETIQFHGTSDVYKLHGAREIAGLYSDLENATGSPSVVINKFGKDQVAAFTYNLPQSIV